MRLGPKQLRNKSQLRDWSDIRDMLGDAFLDAIERMPLTTDWNHARWPTHPLRGKGHTENCSSALPCDVAEADRTAKMRELDAIVAGLVITHGAVSDITAKEFPDVLEQHVEALRRLVEEPPTPLAERLNKATTRYKWAD